MILGKNSPNALGIPIRRTYPVRSVQSVDLVVIRFFKYELVKRLHFLFVLNGCNG